MITKNADTQGEKEVEYIKRIKSLEDDIDRRSGLMSRVFHDIRTPMNAIIGMANIAKKDIGESEKTLNYMDKILSASDYVMALINNILDIAKFEYNEDIDLKDEFNLDKLISAIKDIIMPEIEKKSIDFQIFIGDLTTKTFVGNHLLLNRVLINLISNSSKYVDIGGKITLTIEEISMDKERIELCFEVEDNGIGMSKEFAVKAFQPFQQEKNESATNHDGTGLGLAICKTLLDKIGGTIIVQSELGKGSKFKVEIFLDRKANDFDDEKILKSLELSLDSKHDFLGKRILIVEDNEINIEIICSILEDKNLQIEIARDGQEALEFFEESKEGYFDLILMDIMMPRKNGMEATCEIRSLNRIDSKEIPILAMTADRCNNEVINLLKSNLDDYVLKPIDTKQLFFKLHYWLKTL